MNRRTLLEQTGISVATVVALSGCTEQTLEETETKPPFVDVDDAELDLPITQQTDVVEDGILQAADAEITGVDDFENFLEAQEITVEVLAETEIIIEEKAAVEREDVETVEAEPHGDGLVLELEFVQPDSIDTGILDSIGLIAGGYAALVETGYSAELLEATVLDSESTAYGSFHVLTTWADEYNEEITSARSFGSKPWSTAGSE